jgi:hypothetical protein
MSEERQWRGILLTGAGAGALLVALGIFVSGGWPFLVGGFVLLVAAASLR